MDERRRVIKDGALLVQDSRIAQVGKNDEIKKGGASGNSN